MITSLFLRPFLQSLSRVLLAVQSLDRFLPSYDLLLVFLALLMTPSRDLLSLCFAIGRLCNSLTNLFPLWVIAAVSLALIYPPAVTWLSGNAITYMVGATMVFTGMTLTMEDFTKILQRPSQVCKLFSNFLLHQLIIASLNFFENDSLNHFKTSL